MGHKIITEKDFWMCSSGAMPAQLQGTRKSNKKIFFIQVKCYW